jgi:light-regulated signal transduction histidine kinase (bacteriophytochrome)
MDEDQMQSVLPDGNADLAVAARGRIPAQLSSHHEGLEQSVAEHIVDLAAANKQLAAALKELEGFAYSVSHDLRAPLRAIDGFSRILLEDYADRLDPEGRRVLNVVRDGTLKMSRLIDDILAFSRAARVEMKPEPVDMEALVRQTLTDELAMSLAGRAMPIEIGALPDAHGDRAMLRRVWMNLLDNAIKFTGLKPNGRITVGATAGDGETVYSVSDNGVGFDMRYADKLFGAFQRLHGAEFPGTGIGLAIVKRIVERHGGRVWAEGKVGDGATFYFALPTKGAVP